MKLFTLQLPNIITNFVVDELCETSVNEYVNSEVALFFKVIKKYLEKIHLSIFSLKYLF